MDMSADKKQFEGVIKQLIPISDLSPRGQDDAIEIAEILEFKKKKDVFKEGVQDNYSYYVLGGELELLTKKQVQSAIIGGSDSARYAISQLQPRQYTAKAKTLVTILRLDRSELDRLMVHESNKNTDITDTDVEMGVRNIEEEDSDDWMTSMLQSELFARLPMANIQQLFASLEPVAFNVGDTVIKQGEPGDNYYIISEGRCEVTRVDKEGKDLVKLVELSTGDSFGEEALLLTNVTRNATITMLSDGVLMELSKDSFVELIKKPVLSSVSFDQAKTIIGEGNSWVDVRFTKEYEASHIESSINIPLNILRAQKNKLESDKHYIICCDTGGRSSAAAFLLTQGGFHVSYLQGGLNSNPGAAQIKSESTLPDIVQQAEEQVEDVKSVEEAKPFEAGALDRRVDSAVRASVLEAELAKKKMDIEAAEKLHAGNKQADEKKKAAHEAEKKKLDQEKGVIEKQKELAEEDLDRTCEQEIQKIEKTKQDAELRMQEEKEKLEELYSKNTEEMKKLQKMKARAEAQIKKARKQLLKQTELERNVKKKARALLNEERRKLFEKFAQNNEELEQAQKEKGIAKAGRVAAKEEAEKIIEEYKAKFEKEKAKLQSQLQAERAKLEKESQQVAKKLDKVHKAKDEAETVSKQAEEEASKLKEKQVAKIEKGDKEDKSLEEKMKLAEEKLEEARRAFDDAKHAEKMTEVAKEGIDEDLVKQKGEEEKLNQQMRSELNDWKDGEVEREKQFEGRVLQAERIKRIREKAEEAKRKAREAADTLFSDIASQISSDDHNK